MKIAIEAQRIFRPNKHGMDFVVLEVIRELQKIDKKNSYYIFVTPGPDKCLEETNNFKIIELKMPSYPLWEQVALPLAIKKLKPDLLHCTSNTAPIFCSVPLVLTLHDIIFLEKEASGNKSFYQRLGRIYRRFIVPRILPKCQEIITVSEFECQHILQTLPQLKNRLQAVYNGYNKYFYPRENCSEVITKYHFSTPFLFFLGNTDPKKNTPRVLQAYAGYLKQSNYKYPLIIADMRPEVLQEILKEYHIEEIQPYITLPGYIANSDLPYIYSSAAAFLYPSLRESFGIPILEAMACGVPVITSNTSAMPEIAGSSAILIDPRNTDSITAAILKLENDTNYQKTQIAYGLERVKEFAWENTARKTLQIYHKYLKINAI